MRPIARPRAAVRGPSDPDCRGMPFRRRFTNTAAIEAALVGALRLLFDERREGHGRRSCVRPSPVAFATSAGVRTWLGSAATIARSIRSGRASPAGTRTCREEEPFRAFGAEGPRPPGTRGRRGDRRSSPRRRTRRRRAACTTSRTRRPSGMVTRCAAHRVATSPAPAGRAGRGASDHEELARADRAGPGRSARALRDQRSADGGGRPARQARCAISVEPPSGSGTVTMIGTADRRPRLAERDEYAARRPTPGDHERQQR